MAREISCNNFEISLMVFMPNITTNHAITYTNIAYKACARNFNSEGYSRQVQEKKENSINILNEQS